MTNNKELTSIHFDDQKMGNINNKQRTAVDSIIEFCKNRMFMEASVHQVIYLSLIKFCEEQAKEMEKHRMIKFTNEWFEEYQCGLGNFKNPEKYYEETYGGGEQ
jgi:hypothetical protein